MPFAPSFTGDLTVTQLSGKPGAWRLWRIEQTLTYFVNEQESEIGEGIEIAPGFVTDGPSIPRIFWAVLPVWASWGRAGVLHDYLCCLIAAGRPHPDVQTRADADRVFLDAMKSCGVGILSRTLLYAGVRIGTILKIKTTMIGENAKLQAALQAASS